jgi:hypothetical protein
MKTAFKQQRKVYVAHEFGQAAHMSSSSAHTAAGACALTQSPLVISSVLFVSQASHVIQCVTGRSTAAENGAAQGPSRPCCLLVQGYGRTTLTCGPNQRIRASCNSNNAPACTQCAFYATCSQSYLLGSSCERQCVLGGGIEHNGSQWVPAGAVPNHRQVAPFRLHADISFRLCRQ